MHVRLGLFAIYLSAYLGFVILNAYWPQTMELRIAWGINLAVIYGTSLILSAILLAIIFLFHRADDDDMEGDL